MRNLIKFYSDPAIGFPRLGWAIRFKKTRNRGFGIWTSDGQLYIGVWFVRWIDTVRIAKPTK